MHLADPNQPALSATVPRMRWLLVEPNGTSASEQTLDRTLDSFWTDSESDLRPMTDHAEHQHGPQRCPGLPDTRGLLVQADKSHCFGCGSVRLQFGPRQHGSASQARQATFGLVGNPIWPWPGGLCQSVCGPLLWQAGSPARRHSASASVLWHSVLRNVSLKAR